MNTKNILITIFSILTLASCANKQTSVSQIPDDAQIEETVEPEIKDTIVIQRWMHSFSTWEKSYKSEHFGIICPFNIGDDGFEIDKDLPLGLHPEKFAVVPVIYIPKNYDINFRGLQDMCSKTLYERKTTPVIFINIKDKQKNQKWLMSKVVYYTTDEIKIDTLHILNYFTPKQLLTINDSAYMLYSK